MGKHIKFEHVNTHGNFAAVLDHFGIDYEKRGAQLRALCPFHDDSNPSLSITLEPRGEAKENTFHCFGCKESGSLIDFVALQSGIALRDAAELVAELSSCGLAPPRSTARGKARRSSGEGSKTSDAKPARQSPQKARDDAEPPTSRKASAHVEKSRRNDPAASETPPEINPPLKFTLPLEMQHPYLAERVPPGLALIFGLGVCPLESRSIMAGRCCVPIHNTDGQLIAYAGRYLGEEPKQPKWLLPKGFEKARVLFNAHRVAGASTVAVVEGFFDAIRLHGLGIPAVALMGTALSEAQIAALREMGVCHAVLMMDGDAEGQAVVPNLVAALAPALFVREVTLPEDADPASVPEADLRAALRDLGF